MKQLNLIPYSFREQSSKQKKMQGFVVLVIFVVILGAAGVIIPWYRNYTLNGTREVLQDKLADYSKVMAENKDLTSNKGKLQAYIEKVESVSKHDKLPTEEFAKIEKVMPPDVVLTEADYNTIGNIQLKGATANYPSIAVLAANLEESTNYSSVHISDTILDTQNNNIYTFTIELEFSRN